MNFAHPGPQKVSDLYSKVQSKIVVQRSSFAHSNALDEKKNRPELFIILYRQKFEKYIRKTKWP